MQHTLPDVQRPPFQTFIRRRCSVLAFCSVQDVLTCSNSRLLFPSLSQDRLLSVTTSRSPANQLNQRAVVTRTALFLVIGGYIESDLRKFGVASLLCVRHRHPQAITYLERFPAKLWLPLPWSFPEMFTLRQLLTYRGQPTEHTDIRMDSGVLYFYTDGSADNPLSSDI